jgi:hypothetical protein
MLAIPLVDEAQTLRRAWQIASDPPIEGDIEALRAAFWSAGQGAALGGGNRSALSSCQQIFMQTSPLAACAIKCFGGSVQMKGDCSVSPWMDRGRDHEPARCVVWQFFRPGPWVLVALLPSFGLAQLTAQPNAARQSMARIDALEEQMARLNAVLEKVQARPPEHQLRAALNLQSAPHTSSRYPREWPALRDASPTGALPTRFAEVRASHAACGLATTIELGERFWLLSPMLSAQVSAAQSWVDWGRECLPRPMAAVDLAEGPPLRPAHATNANVSRLLARIQIAPALVDFETLDGSLQPSVTDWMAQARVRVVAEQAMQETILPAFAARAGNP